MPRFRLLVLLGIPTLALFALARWTEPPRMVARDEPSDDLGDRAEFDAGEPRPPVKPEPITRIAAARFQMSGSGTAIVFRPDGRRVAASSYESPVIAEWDAASGIETRRYTDGGRDALVVGYTPDGRRLVTLDGRSRTVVYDANTGAVVSRIPVPVAVAPNGKSVVGVTGHGRVTVWDLETGEVVRAIGTLPTSGGTVCFSPNGEEVAICNRTGTVYVAVLDGKAPVREIVVPGQDGGILRLAWPRADRLIAVWYNGFASHDPASGRQVDRKTGNYAYWLNEVAVAGGRVFAKIVNTPELVELDPKDLSRVPGRTIPFNKWNDPIAVSADGKVVATSIGRKLRLFETATGNPLHPDANLYPTWAPSTIQFSRDGRRMLTDGNHSIRVWDVTTNLPVTVIDRDDGHVNDACLSADGHHVAGIDGAVRDYPLVIWDASTGAEVFRQEPSTKARRQSAVGFDSAGALWVYSGDFTRHEIPSGRVLQTIPGFGEAVWNEMSPDGSRLVSAGWTAFAVRSTDPAADWYVVAKYPGRHEGGCKWDAAPCPTPVAFNPNGRELLTGRGWMFWDGKSHNLRVWDVSRTPTPGAERVFGYRPTFTPNGRYVVSLVPVASGRPRELIVSNAATGAELFRFDPSGEVNGFTFSPDGTRLVVAHADTTLTVWDWTKIELDNLRR